VRQSVAGLLDEADPAERAEIERILTDETERRGSRYHEVRHRSRLREYLIASPRELHRVSREIQLLSVYLSALRMTGMTAWVGLNLVEVHALSPRGTSTQAGQVGLGARFVQKDQSGWIEAELAPLPRPARSRDVRAVLLAGPQRRFLYVSSIFSSA
jgi:hypothetical protein